MLPAARQSNFVINLARRSGNYYPARVQPNGDVIENYGRFISRECAEAKLAEISGCKFDYEFNEVDGF